MIVGHDREEAAGRVDLSDMLRAQFLIDCRVRLNVGFALPGGLGISYRIFLARTGATSLEIALRKLLMILTGLTRER